MKRLARLTEARILRYTDHVDKADPLLTLGGCQRFQMQRFGLKGSQSMYMCFDGCSSDLGCTVILRGVAAEKDAQQARAR